MTLCTPENLSEKQHEVLFLIGQRLTHKQIATSLSVSRGRVSQHVRTLKDKFEVNSLDELVAAHRAVISKADTPYTNDTCTFFKVTKPPIKPEEVSGHDEKVFSFGDSQTFDFSANLTEPLKWETLSKPEALDGKYASLKRIGLMLGVAFGTMIVVIITIVTMLTLSNFLSELH